jgi:hypothetical protein
MIGPAHTLPGTNNQEAAMPLSSLLYTSCSTIAPGDAEAVVQGIIAKATARNADLGLTGALLFTGAHFAQVLEGDDTAIAMMMEVLNHDPRHDHLLIIRQGTIAKRRFGDWRMAYMGPSQFVSRHVTRLLNNPSAAEYRRAADWLAELLSEFASNPAAGI